MEVDARLKSPFTALVAGPTGSGKTVLVANLIKKAATVSTPPLREIIYCYGVWQPSFDALEGLVTFRQGMINVPEDIPSDGANRWLIIDDLMSETSGKQDVNNLFTKYSHHHNISVFYILQNIFIKENVTISRNSQYLFIFKNPCDGLTITNLAKQTYPRNVKFLQDAFADATSTPHSHLLLDLKQNTDERMRVIGNFGSDRMIAYTPK